MARSSKEAIVIILDIGHSIPLTAMETKPKFLENARQCISMIMKRKIFASLKDEVALILLGTEETENHLNYSNIKEVFPLCIPSWNMLKFVEKEIKGTNVNADWLNAVVVGMDLIKNESAGKKFTEKKLVLFSDLNSDVSADKIHHIIEAMKKEDFNLIIIGPDTNIKTEEKSVEADGMQHFANGSDTLKFKTKKQLAGESILNRILNETGGVVCSFADAVPQLMYFQKRNICPTPWNVLLDVGPDIKIPVAGYRKITPATLPSWKTTKASEEGSFVQRETTYIRQDENQTVIEREDVIDGYSYGTTLVPISDVDKEQMSYRSGKKCLSVLGFTKKINVPRHLLIGKGVLYFTIQKDCDSAALALSALIDAMENAELVALARKIYRDDTAPTLGVLFPRISSSYRCLVFVELPYSEDMREFVFPPIITENNSPTQQQLDSVDDLIDSMDLTSVTSDLNETTEALKPKSMLNPYHQHVYHSLAFRAMNPDSELPPVSDYVMNILKSPYENKIEFKLAVKKIKEQFVLNRVMPKPSKKTAADSGGKHETKAGPSTVSSSNASVK